jgi:hypothetical protein
MAAKRWRQILAALCVAGLAGTAWADSRLNELKKRRVDLDRMAGDV